MYFYIINSPIHFKYFISDSSIELKLKDLESIEIYKIYFIILFFIFFNLFHYIQINITICNINYFI